MKRILATLSVLTLATSFAAQTLNPTPSITAPGSANTFAGGYTFAYMSSGTPWNGSLISVGGLFNNYDTQINADYGPHGGNRISFRTKDGDKNSGAGTWNSWNELWHTGNLNNLSSDFAARNLKVRGAVDITANESIPVIRGNGGYIPTGLRFIDDSYSQAGQIQEWAIFKGNTWQKGLAFMRYDAKDRCAGGICDTPFVLHDDGNISLGLANNKIYIPAKMDISSNVKINAKLEAKEVKVTTTPTADFVFEEDYALPKLEEVENFIKKNKHLPEIASAKQMEKYGVNIGDFQIRLLQKIEELTLYSIEQNKLLKAQAERIKKLEKAAGTKK